MSDALLTPRQRLILSRYALQRNLDPAHAATPDAEIAALLKLQELELAARQPADPHAAASDGAGGTRSRRPAAQNPPPASRSARRDNAAGAADTSHYGSDEAADVDAFLSSSASASRDSASAPFHTASSADSRPKRRSKGLQSLSIWLSLGQRVLGAWWRRHPMHMVLEVGEPVLQPYARRRPYQLLALSAAAGALIVLARPWRWNSTQRMVRNSVRRELSGWDLRSLTQLALDSLLATLRTAPRKD